MSMTLWQAQELYPSGEVRNRKTLEIASSWEEGSVRGHFWNCTNWCRSGEYFSRNVTLSEITPEERLPDVCNMGIRGDMDARSAGYR